MSNRLLKKAVSKIDSMPEKEIKRLITLQMTETEMLEALLEKGKVGHCVLEGDIICYANTLFFTLLPTNRLYLGRAEGHRLEELVTDDEVMSYLKTVSAESEEEEKEFYFQAGSEVRIILLSNRLLTTEDGEYLDLSVQDITEDKRKETRLRRSESLAAMTTMAAGIAHEIKNPLAAMQIHLQLLKKAFEKKGSLTGEDAKRYTNVLEEEIDHLNGIAVDFLFAVRPMDVELKKQRLEPVITSLEDFVRPELEEHGIKFIVRVEPFLPQLMLDANYIRQALLNMIKNAMNAMEKGGRLDLIARSDGDDVRIIIRDTGCGIERDKMSKIFEPYFTTKASGTGLGLTVVYKIVKEHGGDISVESTVGEGTTFTVSLPVPSDERIALEEMSDG